MTQAQLNFVPSVIATAMVGRPISTIARETGISRTQVYRILDRAGIKHERPVSTYYRKNLNSVHVGARVGFLTVLKFFDRYRTDGGKLSIPRLLCRCDCGNEVSRTHHHLLVARYSSCGCKQAEINSRPRPTSHPKHDMSVNGKPNHHMYIIWRGIKARCYASKVPHYYLYGGRGIRMAEEWLHDAGAFADYVASNLGSRPSPQHSIDRLDNDGHYEPGNIRWASPTDQARNRRNTIRLTAGGITQTLNEWAEDTGISRHAIYQRIRGGLTGSEALHGKGKA